MAEVYLMIDGERVDLEEKEERMANLYEEYREPEEYQGLGLGRSPLIVSVCVKPDWKPSDGIK